MGSIPGLNRIPCCKVIHLGGRWEKGVGGGLDRILLCWQNYSGRLPTWSWCVDQRARGLSCGAKLIFRFTVACSLLPCHTSQSRSGLVARDQGLAGVPDPGRLSPQISYQTRTNSSPDTVSGRSAASRSTAAIALCSHAQSRQWRAGNAS